MSRCRLQERPHKEERNFILDNMRRNGASETEVLETKRRLKVRCPLLSCSPVCVMPRALLAHMQRRERRVVSTRCRCTVLRTSYLVSFAR